MPLSAKLNLGFNAKQTGTVGLAPQEANISQVKAVSFAEGTLAGQANEVWSNTLTIAASANQDIDLAGTLVDSLGGTAVFAKIKGLYVHARDANTNNVVVGAAAATAWAALLGATHTLTLRPGATFQVMCGQADLTAYAVGAGASDVLRFTNGGAGTQVVLDVAVIGTNA